MNENDNNDYIARLIRNNDIDDFLIPLIVLLNEKGFLTNFCCSGLYQDHMRSKKAIKRSKSKKKYQDYIGGYIAFDKYLTFEQESILEEICYSSYLVFEESRKDDVKSFYDFEKKEHFLGVEESTFLNGCTIRSSFPEVINCSDRRKVTKKFIDSLVEYRWNLVYEKIKNL